MRSEGMQKIYPIDYDTITFSVTIDIVFNKNLSTQKVDIHIWPSPLSACPLLVEAPPSILRTSCMNGPLSQLNSLIWLQVVFNLNKKRFVL